MKKTTEAASATASLPTFLDEPGRTAEPNGDAAATAEATDGDEATEETVAAADAATPGDDATASAAEPEPTPAAEAPRTRANRTSRPAPAAHGGGGGGGGTVATLLGSVALLAAVALPFAPAMAAKLAPHGLGSATLGLGGLVLLAAGGAARRTGALQRQLHDERATRAEELAALQHEVRSLAAHDPAIPEHTENQQHMLLAVQRQDEKLNNLTKATKMYGKPLMEIANQGTELLGNIAAVKTLVEGGSDSSRQALSRMETQLRQQQTNAKQDLGEVQQSLLKLATKLDSLGSGTDSATPQKLAQLEVAIAAIAQRLEDSEVRKSLLRLEEGAAKERDTLQQLLRADAVRSATGELQGQLEKATRGLSDGLQQLRQDNLGGLENVVREIQREVTGVATAVAQIQAAVKNGARVTAPTPTAAPAPTPTTAPAATATPAPSAPTTPNAAAPAANGTTGDGGAYATGTRATAGKNVLGAIAKLKQMKS